MDLKKQKTYLQAFAAAKDRLVASSVTERADAAGLTWTENRGTIVVDIPFLDETITLRIPEMRFTSSRSRVVTLVVKIVLLHYLTTASGSIGQDDMISWEDIPPLKHYGPAFERRILSPLTSAFGGDRDIFSLAGEALGGRREDFGDASFTLTALPLVPITFILWEHDDEFPASVRVLYRSSVTALLPLEDIVVLTKLAATRIIHRARLLAGVGDV